MLEINKKNHLTPTEKARQKRDIIESIFNIVDQENTPETRLDFYNSILIEVSRIIKRIKNEHF